MTAINGTASTTNKLLNLVEKEHPFETVSQFRKAVDLIRFNFEEFSSRRLCRQSFDVSL